jgi:MFS family permease
LGGVQDTRPFLHAIGVFRFFLASMHTSSDGFQKYPTGTYIIPMIASCYTLAAAVGSVVVSLVGLPLGRRNCIALGDICVIVGGSLQASAWSVPQIIIARVICVSQADSPKYSCGLTRIRDLELV